MRIQESEIEKSQSRSQAETPFKMVGTFKDKMLYLLDVVKQHRRMCQMHCEFDDDGNHFFTDTTHQYDFMQKNYNNLISGQETFDQYQQEITNDYKTGKVDQEELDVDKSLAKIFNKPTVVPKAKRRWLYDNEMKHLRGCLIKLQMIKTERIGSREECQHSSADIEPPSTNIYIQEMGKDKKENKTPQRI